MFSAVPPITDILGGRAVHGTFPFQIQHYANKQYHPFRANHGFCEVRFAPMSGHRETQSPRPKTCTKAVVLTRERSPNDSSFAPA
jgi:hypothetical protein